MEMATNGPVMDWSPDNGLPNRYKQKCILLFETLLCVKCYYVILVTEVYNFSIHGHYHLLKKSFNQLLEKL